jgi:hypothetical protein
MDRFDRALLSALRVADEPTALPFSLRWHDIATALVGLEVDRASECRSFKRYEVRGLRNRSRSAIVSVSYPTARGHMIVDMFLKRTPRAACEAERHAQLVAEGVPVPRLLCDVELADGDHVLCFEFLDTVGVDFTADQIAELLTLVATLNAVPPAALGAFPSPPSGRPETDFTAGVEAALTAAAGLLSWASLTTGDWLDLYQEAKRWARRMPTAVTHGEMYFQQVGRARTGPLVVFDLATVGLRPRFSDLCSLLRGLAAHGRDERSLLENYLDVLQSAGATAPPVTDAVDELRRLRVLGAFQSLPWLTRSLDDPDLGPTALTENIDCLRRDLAALAIVCAD